MQLLLRKKGTSMSRLAAQAKDFEGYAESPQWRSLDAIERAIFVFLLAALCGVAVVVAVVVGSVLLL